MTSQIKDVIDLEHNCQLNFEEKLAAAYDLFISPNVKIAQKEQVLEWFVSMKNKPDIEVNQVRILYDTILKCFRSPHMTHLSGYKIKSGFMESILKILKPKEPNALDSSLLKCCIIILNNDNYARCFQGDVKFFIKFLSYASIHFSENITHDIDRIDLFNKLLSIFQKMKWNQQFSWKELNSILVSLAKLYHWIQSEQEENSQRSKEILEQCFYSVVTKDGALCGIFLTSFHDESILMNNEYSNIHNIINILKALPSEEKAHISGTIYHLVLSTSLKLSEEYFGSIAFVFEKLDSFIHIHLSNESFYDPELELEVCKIVSVNEKLDKLAIIFKYMIEFLVTNNVQLDLPLRTQDVSDCTNLEELLKKISYCLMYIISQNPPSNIIDTCYNCLNSIFTFSPTLTVVTFRVFNQFCIFRKQNSENSAIYSATLSLILKIHFKLSKESKFLEVLLFEYRPSKDKLSLETVLPETFCNSLINIVSNESTTRVLKNWLHVTINGYKHWLNKIELKSFSSLYLKINLKLLSSTLCCTILQNSSFKTDSLLGDALCNLLSDIKSCLVSHGKLILYPFHHDLDISGFLTVCIHWGALKLLCCEYDLNSYKSDIQNTLSRIEPPVTAHVGVHILHNYFEAKEWSIIFKKSCACDPENWEIINSECELFVQSLDVQALGYYDTTFNNALSEKIAVNVVAIGHWKWLLKHFHLIDQYLSISTKYSYISDKLGRLICDSSRSKSVFHEILKLLQEKQFQELNVVVLGFTLHILNYLINHNMSGEILARDIIINILENEDQKCVEKQLRNYYDHIDKKNALNEIETESDEDESSGAAKKRRIKESIAPDNEEFNEKQAADDCGVKQYTQNLIKLCMEPLDGMLVESSSTEKCAPADALLQVLSCLPLEHLESSSQRILFLLIFIYCRIIFTKTKNSIKSEASSLLKRLVQSEQFNVDKTLFVPIIQWVDTNLSESDKNVVLAKLCKKVIQNEESIQAVASQCEITLEHGKIDEKKIQNHVLVTFHLLNTLQESKARAKSEIKKKIISSAYANFKQVNPKPSLHMLPLYSFMLSKSLKKQDNQGTEILCLHLHEYLELALNYHHYELIETVLVYSDLVLKNHIPVDFIPKVWHDNRGISSLCFQSASLVQFNAFVTEMFSNLQLNLLPDDQNQINLEKLQKIFNLYRKLMVSNLSRNSNAARMTELEKVINCFSTHITLYVGDNTRHFEPVFDFVLDILYSSIFSVNANIVLLLFNLITTKSCVCLRQCIKLLQYLITKKSSIVSDQTALFLLKFRTVLRQLASVVCKDDPTATEEYYKSILIYMEKLANSMRKEKKCFQRVCPYLLSDIVQLFEQHKFPLYITVFLNDITNTFISICDEHGISFLKNSLTHSSKQIFMQRLESYNKYNAHRFV